MMKMKWLLPFLALISIISSCKNKTTGKGSFDDVLSQPPFAALTDSIKNEPGNDSLYFRRAVLLNSKDFSEPALLDFKKAWSLKKQEEYAFGLANLLLEKKPDSAILFLKDAIQHLPKSFLLQL